MDKKENIAIIISILSLLFAAGALGISYSDYQINKERLDLAINRSQEAKAKADSNEIILKDLVLKLEEANKIIINPLISCWFSNEVFGDVKVSIRNDGYKISLLEHLSIESKRVFYRGGNPEKPFDSEAIECTIDIKELRPGEEITQDCKTNLVVNHVTLKHEGKNLNCNKVISLSPI